MNDSTICKVTERLTIAANCYVTDDVNADANLIASAPDLYEALEGLMKEYLSAMGWVGSPIHNHSEQIEMVVAAKALAKARGESC